MKKTMKLPHSYSSSSFRGSDHSPDFVIPVTRHLGMPRTMHLISPCEAFYMRRIGTIPGEGRMWRRCPGTSLQRLELALPFTMVSSGRFAHGSAPASWCSELVLPSQQMLSDRVCKERGQHLTRGNLRQGMVYFTHKGKALQGQVSLESSRQL